MYFIPRAPQDCNAVYSSHSLFPGRTRWLHANCVLRAALNATYPRTVHFTQRLMTDMHATLLWKALKNPKPQDFALTLRKKALYLQNYSLCTALNVPVFNTLILALFYLQLW